MNVSTHTARALATPRTPVNALARMAMVVLAAAALLAIPATAEAQTLTIGNAATGEATSTVAPGGAKVVLDAFTLTASTGTAVVTSVTVTLPVGSAALIGQLTIEDSAACAMATPYGAVVNPGSDAPAVATSGLSVLTGAARPFWVCMKPKAATAMPAVPGSSLAVTGRVTGAVAAGYTTNPTADVASLARTIDNASPGPVTAVSGVAGDHQVGLKWTNPVDPDFREVVILYGTGAVNDVPVEGVAYQPFTFNNVLGTYQPTLIGTSRVGYVGNATTTAIGGGADPATWLANGTAYSFKIFARDQAGNYSQVGVAAGPFTPVAYNPTTIGAGSESASSVRAPGGAIADLDAFTLMTTNVSDQVRSVTVTLSPANAYQVVDRVQIVSNDGVTLYGEVVNPTSNTVLFPTLSTFINTTIAPTVTQYRVRIQPKAHAAMPAVPGAQYAVTGLVTAFVSNQPHVGSDANSSTVTIDNLSPNAPVLGTVTTAATSVTLNWTNPGGDFRRVTIVQSTGPVTAAPVEGDLGATVTTPPAITGTGTVVFTGAAATATIGGLTSGSTYYFKIFAQDTSGNWSVGTAKGPITPGSGASGAGSTDPDTLLPVVQIVNPTPGARVSTKFKVQVRAYSPNGVGNVPQPVTVVLKVNGAVNSTLTRNAKYAGDTTRGVFETVEPLQVTLAAGTYTLTAEATNATGTVVSNAMQVTVSATPGDGNLLVRDNAPQLCTDCHSLPTHSSEATGSTYGSWSTSCRDCHVPHGTHNVFLVGDTITPPQRGAVASTAKPVAFSNTTGTAGNAAARTTATYVNTDNTGPCQVCHTMTLYYRADGSSPGGLGHQSGQRCTNCHQHSTGMAINCTGCHGDSTRLPNPLLSVTDPRLTAAPPRDTAGLTVRSSRGVGAHQPHLNQNNLRTNPLACSDCHPASNSHQGTVDMGWGPLANGAIAGVPLTPNFNGATCSSTWCHSAGGSYGGSNLAPTWTGDATQVTCGACHGAPPPAPHPANPTCNNCHPGYSLGGINATAKLTHIDGTLQIPALTSCTACHGVASRPAVVPGTDPNINVAPPMFTDGTTGADPHLAHINKQSAPVHCLDCHGTLPVVGDPSHPNGSLDVTMASSALANQDGGFAVYATGSCSTVYCHGASFPTAAKGTTPLPTWSGTLGCDACHGAPPGDAIHATVPGLTACSKCHDQTVTSTGAIIGNAGLHVNGIVETNVMDNGCASCHGTIGRTNTGAGATFFEAAPPASVPGSPGAGVHLQHVNGTRSRNVECEECHLGSKAFEVFSPNPATAWLHADGITDVGFGGLASQGGVTPAYTVGTGGSCAATYCHGNFSGGAGAGSVSPTWLTAGTLACTACHGNPPALPHPQNDGCASCHGTGYAKTGNLTGTVVQVNHVDGTTTGQTFGCTSCHGVINTASPGATSGAPTLAAPGVGGGLAVTTAAAPAVSVPQYGLHAVHLTQNGYTAEPIACGNCHQVPADGNTAHGSGTGGSSGAGSALVAFSALAQGNVAARITPVVAVAGKGATATSTAAVGPTPGGASIDAWSTPANPSYTRPNCSNVYCHGEFRNGQQGKTIAWNANLALTCNSCHGTPGPNPATHPTGGHPASDTCGSCHNGYTQTSVNVATHLNGKLEYSGGTACSDCHGDATRLAMTPGTFGPNQTANNLLGMPPKDTQGNTAGGVRTGAHQSHAVPTTPSAQVFRTVACSECHGIGVNSYGLGHSNGSTELTFASSVTANLGGISASIVQNVAPTPDTCTTYCHGASLTAQQRGSVATWQWTSTAAATCGSCHGAAPGDAVHTSVGTSAPATACNPCHNTVVNTSGGIIFNGTGTSATTLHINGTRQATTSCTSCHGTLGVNAAPPRATSGTTLVTNPAVGAHQKHLTGSSLRVGALACDNCHVVPTAQNHATGAVNVSWNTLASVGAGGAYTLYPAAGTIAAAWEATATTPTCTNYCHGGKWAATPTSRGNQYQANWTLGTSQMACNSCHLAPPASSGHSSYVATTNCGSCHSGYNCFGNSLATCTVNKTVHLNGTPDVPGSCDTCHGTTGRTMTAGGFGPAQASANLIIAMPPKDTQGATAGGIRTGAHQSHAVPTTLTAQTFRPVQCSECHGVVVNGYVGAHSNGTTELTFASSTTANLGGVSAAIVQNTGTTPDTCTTYCHGASLTPQQRGSVATWQWTATAAATCGSCHGAAPGDAVHTSVGTSAPVTACNPCHNTVVNTSGGIIFNGTGTSATTLHVNGTRQNTAACNSCHGGALNPAPPVATSGTTLVTNPKVGAHQRHLSGSSLRLSALACDNCHAVPVSMTHASGTRDVAWNTLASAASGYTLYPANGAVPAAWEATATTPTCTNYCHGGKWAATPTYRGNTYQPLWISSGVATQCNDCHLAPPGSSSHDIVVGLGTKNCGDCHSGYNCTTGNLAACQVNKAIHLNGLHDAEVMSCTSCHGTSGGSIAPPVATNGTTAVTSPRVGAHQRHVVNSTLRSATLACGECHQVPGSTTHSNATVELPWATLARTGGITPTPGNLAGATRVNWEATATTPTCTNYCHGGKWAAAPADRGNQYVANWTLGTSQAACNSCHLAPPATGHASYVATTNCGSCHNGYNCFGNSLATCTVNKTVHINGIKDAPGSCDSCHGTTGRTMTAGGFGPAQASANLIIAMPPKDTQGATAGGIRTGAHQSHAVPTTLAAQTFRPVQCSECHGIVVNGYVTAHSNGTTELTFASSTTANLGGVSAAIVKNTGTTPDTCTTYCHGASLTAQQRGSVATWQWTSTAAATCGSCHGAAPGDAVHTSVGTSAPVTACNPCHNTVVNTSGGIIFNGTGTSATTLHINGSRQSTTACNSCHGGALNAAPPVATSGTTLVTNPAVGAHQKHLTGSSLRLGALACDNCHTVPTAQNHANGAVNIAWNTLATTGAGYTIYPAAGTIAAAWEATATTPTCTNYCHGGKWAAVPTSRGNQYQANWTLGTSQMACNSCHLAPPASSGHSSYVATTNCGSCHAGYNCFGNSLATCTVNKTVHLNGTANVPSSCDTCHGTTGRTMTAGGFGPAQASANLIIAMPPKDTQGATAGGIRTGAHQSHAVPTTLTAQTFRPVQCSECHGIVVNGYVGAHSNGTTELTFASSTTANLGGVSAAIVQNTGTTPDTCTTYCHGASLTAQQRGSVATWQWTSTAAATCGSCHGAAPGDAVHTSVGTSAPVTACNPCHNTVVNTSGGIIFNGTGTSATTLHINGTRQSTTTCTSCHGTSGVNNAPPRATNGATVVTNPAVGAHQKHLVGSSLRVGALACDNCHAVPTAQNHATGAVNVAWNTLASVGAGTTFTMYPAAGTIAAAWEATATTPTCTNYCHGGKWAAVPAARGNQYQPNWTLGTSQAACNSCHLAPPGTSDHGSVTASTNCNDCHGGYVCFGNSLATCTVNKTTHINGSVEATGGTCVGCHAKAITTGSVPRRAIVPEFGYAWSHKRSASPAGTVTNNDCAVCHMEGVAATGAIDTTYHRNALVNLRDPDLGTQIKQVTWGGANAGGYTSTAVDATFASFRRNLSSNVLEPTVQAIMINQCLKCHDANGANNALARVPTGSAAKPFGTTIAGANYTGNGVTALNTLGGVTDVNASFATSNASYHPVRGKQNNSYVGNARMNAPWNAATKTAGTTTSWGYLISCWDCHAPQGATGVQTLTVTAHGGTTTIRKTVWATNVDNLCNVCHQVQISGNNHGAGSAFGSSGNGSLQTPLRQGCQQCHGSTYNGSQPRPIRGQDAHGFDAFIPRAPTTDTMWPVGSASNTYRPYAFIRNAGVGGTWNTTSWKPLSGPGVGTGSATCGGSASLGGGSCSNQGHGTYSPGGVY